MYNPILRYSLLGACFSSFDPDSFMTTTVDAPMETEFKLCPEGDFQAMIDDFDRSVFEQFDFKRQNGEDGSMTKFNCPFVINSDEAKAALNRDKVVVQMQIILDLIPGTTQLDFGVNKNVRLGQLREAVNQNAAGAWGFSQLKGAGPVMVKVQHRSGKRKDGSDYKIAEVTRVVKIS